MFSSRISRYIHLNRSFKGTRSFCQQAAQSEKPKNVFHQSKELYYDVLPFAVTFSFLGSLFNGINNSFPEETFLEYLIYSSTVGLFVGFTYPLSFPLITMNVLKKIHQSKQPYKPFSIDIEK